jgi:ectoine hydroxylase-related dioxygenase (phytanoyl-CoA dioxygenase family)
MKKVIVERPVHIKDSGQAHIMFGEDPKPILQKYGYCVVESVFNKELCEETINAMWRWLENLGTGIDRKDEKTWDNTNWPAHIKQGLIQHTLAHEKFMWKIREHDHVIKVFSQIYGTNELLTSFDGATIIRPLKTGYTHESKESWLHTDSNIIHDVKVEDVYASPYYSIQGIANLADSGDRDASLFVGESSHLMHSNLFLHNKRAPKNHWYVLRQDDINYLTSHDVKFVKVNAPAGSLILFDSRCFHSGFAGDDLNNSAFRYVIYVSQTPAVRATKEDLALKKKALVEGKATSHWSSCNIKIFDLPIRHSYMSREKNKPNFDSWSDKRKKLAGLQPY